MSEFVKKPCAHCPYRRDVTPFLRPERAEELANAACNPYSVFTCHKTLEHDDEGETYAGQNSQVCAGFLTLQHHMNGGTSYDRDGFVPSKNCYEDSWEMIEAYEEEAA